MRALQNLLHGILMFDELVIEKQPRWDDKSNKFLGVCREHGHVTNLDFMSLSGHGVASFPIWVLYSHASLVGTAEDLSSQMTKLKYHVIDQMIQIMCKVT